MPLRAIEMTEHPDIAIDRIAGAQHGVIRRSQAASAGLSERAIDRRVSAGRLHTVFRGVYRVGPVMSRHARAMGAVLACGANAVLSYRSAASMWNLPGAMPGDAVDVTIPRERSSSTDAASIPNTSWSTLAVWLPSSGGIADSFSFPPVK